MAVVVIGTYELYSMHRLKEQMDADKPKRRMRRVRWTIAGVLAICVMVWG